MNMLRWSAILITALLAFGQIHAAPGGNQYRCAIKAVRFSVDAAGQFSQSPGGAETLFEVIEDRNSAARAMLHYSGLALSSDGKRLAFLSIPDASPWPSEDVRVPMVCELPGCRTLTAVADAGWYESPAWGQDGALLFVRRGASTSALPDDSQTWVASAQSDQDGQWMSSDSLELNGLRTKS